MSVLVNPVELSDADLDAVSGGQRQQGLVNVQNVRVTVRDVNIAVAVQALNASDALEIDISQ